MSKSARQRLHPARFLYGTWLALAIAGCAALPSDLPPPPKQFAPAPFESGVLAEISDTISDSRESDISGFHLLDRNADALSWRLALIDSAQASLDILYYLWLGDSGRLLLKRVIDAADRGVQVRLIIDDLILIGQDRGLALIQQHPNIELRLFNPKRHRKLGMVLSSLANFDQLNSRLHDKLIVADNQAAILGGRNIGDEYFGLNPKFNFHDLDVMGFGPVAPHCSDLFDSFWNSSWVVSADQLPIKVTPQEAQDGWNQMLDTLAASTRLSSFPIDSRTWRDELLELVPKLHLGASEVIYDRIEEGELARAMADPLGELLRSAEHEIRITNAYIIPHQDSIYALGRIVRRGVEIHILTNSLASHDVPAVNSQYKLWREPLLKAGVHLYEWRSDPAIKTRVDTPPVVAEFSGLHTKSFVVDARKVFIGSMNFDPRSANINSEMGIIIESESLGAEMVRLAERDMAPQNAWQVGLDEEGKPVWRNSDETVTRQPARSNWQRVQDGMFRLVPKSQL